MLSYTEIIKEKNEIGLQKRENGKGHFTTAYRKAPGRAFLTENYTSSVS